MFYSEACNNDERENDEESEDEGGSVSNLPTVSLKNLGISGKYGNIGEYWENDKESEDEGGLVSNLPSVR